jgi:hypothetical protein
VLDTAIKLYSRNAVTMWKIVGVVVIPLAVLQILVLAASLPSGAFVHDGTLYTSAGTLSAPAVGTLAQSVLGLLAILVVNGALALCLVDSYLGRPLSWSRSLQAAFGRLGALLWLAIIFAIAIVIAFILIILPGIWLSVAWAVAVPALMVEESAGSRRCDVPSAWSGTAGGRPSGLCWWPRSCSSSSCSSSG